MILEKDYGTFLFRGEEFKLESSYHTKDGRNSSIPRDALSKSKYINIIIKGESKTKIKDNIDCALIWETSTGNFKGIAIAINLLSKKIKIITTFLFNSQSPDKVLKNATQRIIIGKLDD